MKMLRRRGTERGGSILEIVGWIAAFGVVAAIAAYVVIAKPGQAKTQTLSPKQQEYVQAVATQQALAYIEAVATQQADAYIRAVATQQADAVALDESPTPARTIRNQPSPQPDKQMAPTSSPASVPPTTQAPPLPTIIPQATATAVVLLTRDDLIRYAEAKSLPLAPSCFADALLAHFTLEEITKMGIAAAASSDVVASDLSWCVAQGKPDGLP